MKIALSAAAAVLALAAIPLPSQAMGTMGQMGPYYSRTFQTCMSRGGNAIGGCLSAERRRWDNELNATYQQLKANLSGARWIELRNEERAWIVRKDGMCRNAGNSLDVTQCLLDETIRRELYLRSYQ